MGDAPEKIWAMAPYIGEYLCEPPVNPEDMRFFTVYTRADIAETRIRELERLLNAAVNGPWQGYMLDEARAALEESE